MANNSILGWIWLGGVAAVISTGASKGMERSHAEHEKMEKAEKEEAYTRLKQGMAAAVMLAQREQYEPAIAKLEAIDEEFPNNPSVLQNLAIIYRAQENYDKAVATLDRAMKAAPEDWDIVAEKATILVEQKRLDDALALAETIPARLGRMTQRLRGDPVWLELERSDRLNALLAKHGIGMDGMAETGVSSKEEIERQRRQYPKEVKEPAPKEE